MRILLGHAVRRGHFTVSHSYKLVAFSKDDSVTKVGEDKETDDYLKHITAYHTVSEAADEDFEALRAKWRFRLVGDEGNDMTDPDLAARIKSIEERGREHMQTMRRGSNLRDLWSDAHISTTAEVSTKFGNIKRMCLAYGTYGSELYKNAKLKDDIFYALEWVYQNFYGPNELAGKGWKSTSDYNWWDWQIEVPRQLVQICMIMYDEMTPEMVKKYFTVFDNLVTSPTGTGSNLVNSAYLVIGASILENDAKRLENARNTLDSMYLYTDGEQEFRKDGSYLMHYRHPYNSSYGADHLYRISSIPATAIKYFYC